MTLIKFTTTGGKQIWANPERVDSVRESYGPSDPDIATGIAFGTTEWWVKEPIETVLKMLTEENP